MHTACLSFHFFYVATYVVAARGLPEPRRKGRKAMGAYLQTHWVVAERQAGREWEVVIELAIVLTKHCMVDLGTHNTHCLFGKPLRRAATPTCRASEEVSDHP